MMMKGAHMERGEGERLHSARRRKFWVLIGGLAAIGAVAGFGTGFVEDNLINGGQIDPGLATAASIGIVVVAILAAWGSWRFFVTVDEVELADNLWGSLIGFYAYALLFPAWWALWKIGRAPEPDDWLIFGAAMVTATVAYLVRKWRAR